MVVNETRESEERVIVQKNYCNNILNSLITCEPNNLTTDLSLTISLSFFLYRKYQYAEIRTGNKFPQTQILYEKKISWQKLYLFV